MTDDELETLRDWWDGLRKDEQLAAYIAEKSNANGLASTRSLGVEEAIARCQQMLAASEATADREITRLRGLLADERAAHARTTLGAAFDRDALDEVVSAAQVMVESLDDPLGATYSRSLVMGLTMDELRVAVATADQYHPQWRRSLQNGPFHAESKE